jgi:N-acetylated-alpha-linked acidic dipeptidase
LPKIPCTPLSYADAWPILEHLNGPDSPREWQGSLPFTYHVGPGPVKVHIRLKQDYQYRTIWDVIGSVPGSESPGQWVIAGNHRDAWVYGAVDPNSGTAAMLEAVRGVGELLKSGWRPKRTLVFASWDGEEEGLIGSTEWAEQYADQLSNAVYFNTDVAVAGPKFTASAVPSLKQFIREITQEVPSPKGGTVYDAWREAGQPNRETSNPEGNPNGSAVPPRGEVAVGDLGSGSDYTPFLQHFGVPSTDIGSVGPYGVYHSVFDDFTWFTKFADPSFLYEQEMARVFGLEAIRMADADVLPFDYEEYGKEIAAYIDAAQRKADNEFGERSPSLEEALDAAHALQKAGTKLRERQKRMPKEPERLNQVLCQAERALLIPQGLPNRPWYRHAIYAPGVYTGYAAVVIPGVNEAIDSHDLDRTQRQISLLTQALNRAAAVLAGYR